MRNGSRKWALVGGWLATVAAGLAAEQVTPAQWLKQQPAPQFARGHHLPPLSRWGWVLPLDARQELADRWGYALEFGGYTDFAVAQRGLTNAASDEAKILALMEQNPRKYKLACILSRWEPGPDSPPETWLRDADGNFLGEKGSRVYSPEMPMSVIERAAEERAGPLRLIRRRVPIAVVLNGGEYMLNVPGFVVKWAEKDPAVVKAKGDRSWPQYISEQKARESKLIADAVCKAVPDREVYIFYQMGGGARNPQDAWSYHFDRMRTVADYPSEQYYFKDWNSGFMGEKSLLSLGLAARGYELKFGCRNSYQWTCAGWVADDSFAPTQPPDPDRYPADLRLWEGFLKCLYATGLLGANAGYYTYPKGGFSASFPEDRPPHWLQQMVVLSRVHAQFSHLESYLRKGDLLPGPGTHVLAPDQPAYEMHTGDPDLHVLVRRQPRNPPWLLVAWAADGADRYATVAVPGLGTVRVLCRSIGTIYTATVKRGQPVLDQRDADEPYAPFPNEPAREGLQVWLQADAGVTVREGKVTGWANQVSPQMALVPPKQAPALAPGAIGGKPAIEFSGQGTALALNPLPVDLTNEVTALIVWAAPVGQAHAPYMPGAQRVIALPGATLPVYKQPYLPAGKGPVPPRVTVLSGKMNEKAAALALGADPTGDWAFEGRIAEFLLYNRKLTAGELARTKAYLAQKYGL